MKFEIKNRWSGEVQYSVELSAEIAGKSYSLQLGAAIKSAVDAGADLSGADLSGANLSDADLGGANLSGANLRDAYLLPIRDDVWAVLSSAPHEAASVRDALAAGKVDGSTYSGECACLVGTIAAARHCGYSEIEGLRPNSRRPAEMFFTTIRPGNTPENHGPCRIAHGWVSEWIARMEAAFGPALASQAVGVKDGR